jgi:hypothetical protein
MEVKGPHDALSDIQREWLHVLVELPGNVGGMVCHVKESIASLGHLKTVLG